MRKLEVGDRVKMLEDCGTSLFGGGDILYIVGNIGGGTGSCPFYLSKDKVKRTGNFFGPWATSYELFNSHIILRGEL